MMKVLVHHIEQEIYHQTSNIGHTKSQHLNVSCLYCSCLCPTHWSQVLSQEWRCSWSSADRRCSNNIWVINNFLFTKVYITGLMVQCKPDISRSCISRNRIYRGRMLDPIFWPPISLISRTWLPRVRFFRDIAVIPWTPFTGDSFSRNLLTSDAFDLARRRQFSAKSALGQSGLPVKCGHTCCAMASHGRRIIDTSIVSQSRVLLIRCPCKSVPQTANQGKKNAFLIKSSLTGFFICIGNRT